MSERSRHLDALARPVLDRVPDRGRIARTLLWRMRVFAAAQVLDVAVLLYSPWIELKVATAVAFALYRSRTVWTIIHDRVHQPPLPLTPAVLFYDFCTGWIAHWWRRHHLAHHARTNTPDDPDTHLFFGRDMNAVTSPPRSTARRALGLLGTLAQYPVFFALFFYRSLRSHHGRAWPFLLAMAAYGALLSAVLPPWEARLNTLANMGLGTLYIVFTFAPTHTAAPGNFERTGDRATDQVLATNDVWPGSPLYSWLCGGINRHTAHHLFPHVPSEHLGSLVPVVQQWAEEHSVPLRRYTPWGLWRAHVAFLARF